MFVALDGLSCADVLLWNYSLWTCLENFYVTVTSVMLVQSHRTVQSHLSWYMTGMDEVLTCDISSCALESGHKFLVLTVKK